MDHQKESSSPTNSNDEEDAAISDTPRASLYPIVPRAPGYKQRQLSEVVDTEDDSDSNESSEYVDANGKIVKLLMVEFKVNQGTMGLDFPQEIIQMGVSVLHGPAPYWKAYPEKSFESFVRPTINLQLDPGCTENTGIRQEDVDNAEVFPIVFEKFVKWLEDEEIYHTNFAVVTDSRDDVWKHAQYQFILSKMDIPPYFRRFINIWRLFETPTAEEQAEKNKKRNFKNLLKRNRKHEQLMDEIAPKGTDDWVGDYKDFQATSWDPQDTNRQSTSRASPFMRPLGSQNPFAVGASGRSSLFKAEKHEKKSLTSQDTNSQGSSQNPFVTGVSGKFLLDKANAAKEKPSKETPLMDTPHGSKSAETMVPVVPDQPVEENLPEEEPLAKKPKKEKSSLLDRLCDHYDLDRYDKQGALYDAKTLRFIVEKLILDKKEPYFNCMLVCENSTRKKPLKINAEWRMQLRDSNNVWERVLPLYARGIPRNHDFDLNKCISCDAYLDICFCYGIHKQFPTELFASTEASYGEIQFAVVAGLNVAKYVGSRPEPPHQDAPHKDAPHQDGGESSSKESITDLVQRNL